jgi:hypothetical protein
MAQIAQNVYIIAPVFTSIYLFKLSYFTRILTHKSCMQLVFRRTAVWLGRMMKYFYLRVLCNYCNTIYNETTFDISLNFN